MSDYGNPPRDPSQPDSYGQPNPSGQPGQPGQNPYGQPSPYGQQTGYGQPAYSTPGAGYAHWGKRVGANIIDGLVNGVPYIVLSGISGVLAAQSADGTSGLGTVLLLLGAVTSLALFVWNTCLKGGRTGYTVGKGALGIKLINESTGQPIGAWMAFVRNLAHVLDAISCYVGYFWPLWDKKRQTFADKVCHTVVIDQPKG